MLRYQFSYVKPAPLPEVPEEEPSDPNADRELSDSFRTARRTLVALCAVCIAWSTAQFSVDEMSIEAAGITVDLKNASVPAILGLALAYLAIRWAMEFAMMSRHVRRWPLAQLDFRIVWWVTRFALLAVAAGALDRSLRSTLIVAVSLVFVTLTSMLLAVIMTFVFTPIRIWARKRAGAVSAANAVIEAYTWGVFFAILFTVMGVVALGVASYRYEPFRLAVWPQPPSPVALGIFVFVLILSFLSRWVLRPVYSRIFADKPPYYTERDAEGRLRYHFVDRNKDPLL